MHIPLFISGLSLGIIVGSVSTILYLALSSNPDAKGFLLAYRKKRKITFFKVSTYLTREISDAAIIQTVESICRKHDIVLIRIKFSTEYGVPIKVVVKSDKAQHNKLYHDLIRLLDGNIEKISI